MMPRLIPFAAAAFLCLGVAAHADEQSGAGVPHEPAPNAPADATSGVKTPQPGGSNDPQLAQCSEQLNQGYTTVANPAATDEDAAAHERRVRAVVKLYVAGEMEKTKNAKACLARVEEAKQLLAGSSAAESASGSSR